MPIPIIPKGEYFTTKTEQAVLKKNLFNPFQLDPKTKNFTSLLLSNYKFLLKPGVLKLFCIATLFKIFFNLRDPRILQTSINLS
jgi:hypothetical protein